MFRRAAVVLVIASFAVWACSEATDGLVPPAPYDAGVIEDSSSPGSGEPEEKEGFDATTRSSSPVLINEISGGGEWIELVNSSPTTTDLSGWKVADRDKDTGEPKLDDALTFPAGTKLAASAYGMVQGGGIDGGKSCPKGGQSFCFNAEFGISRKNGETLFLVASDGGIVGTVAYPADASAGDDTYGRIPNGDPNGTFQVTPATPGAPNVSK